MENGNENIGVGKTKLSIQLAKRYDGEIINADAMQMYKGLNVATAKVGIALLMNSYLNDA